jgi:hypothetical protein
MTVPLKDPNVEHESVEIKIDLFPEVIEELELKEGSSVSDSSSPNGESL